MLLTASSKAHGQALRRKIRLASGNMLDAIDRFWSQPDLPARYPELLFQIHCVVRASVPVMEAARLKAEELSPSDEVAAGMADYLGHHIPEELGHDDWLLDDMEALGIPRGETLRRIPSAPAAALVGTVYYWVLHGHPLAWMGYAAVCEGHPPSDRFLLDVMERTGLPKEAFRTYLKHARIDPHHARELDETLDSLPLTADQLAMIGVVAFQTMHHLTALFEGITGTPL